MLLTFLKILKTSRFNYGLKFVIIIISTDSANRSIKFHLSDVNNHSYIVFKKGNPKIFLILINDFSSKFNVADTNDFLETVQDVMDRESYTLDYDLKSIMDKWIHTEGFPILHVKRDYMNKTIEIMQERFFSDEKPSSQTWLIPINYATERKLNFNKTIPDFWLKNETGNFSVDAESFDWILLNKQQTGE